MTLKKLEKLEPSQRAKFLNALSKDDMFYLNNCRLTLTDWERYKKTLDLLERYEFECEEYRETLLNAEVATRTELEDERLETLKTEIRSRKSASLKKTQK